MGRPKKQQTMDLLVDPTEEKDELQQRLMVCEAKINSLTAQMKFIEDALTPMIEAIRTLDESVKALGSSSPVPKARAIVMVET